MRASCHDGTQGSESAAERPAGGVHGRLPGRRVSLDGDPVCLPAPGQLGAGGDRGGQLLGVLVGPLDGVAGRVRSSRAA